MADDDLFGFFNELKEVKAPEEEAGPNAGEGEAPEHQDGRHLGSTILNASGKRGRDEEPENVSHDIGPTMPPSHHPAFKKAKAAAAKPLLYGTAGDGDGSHTPTASAPLASPYSSSGSQEMPSAFAPAISVSAAPTRARPESNVPATSSSVTASQDFSGPYSGTTAPPQAVAGAGVGTLFTVGAGAKPAAGTWGAGQQPRPGGAPRLGGGTQGQTEAGKPKKFIRIGPGQTWEDPTLNEWPENDFRIFCGDLGPEVTDEHLTNAFRGKYPSFAKAKVLRDRGTGKSRGYGFVSFLDPLEGLKALREMNGKYVGSRPVKLRKCDWKERDLKEVRKKEKTKKKFLSKLGLG